MRIDELATKEDVISLHRKVDKLFNFFQEKSSVNEKRQEGSVDFAVEVIEELTGGCKPSTVYKRTHEGSMPFEKRGKRLWFRRDQLETWIEAGMPHWGQMHAANKLAEIA